MRDAAGAAGVPQRELPSPIPAHPGDALITEERAHTYRQVLARRCADIAVVIEDCYDPHNATAIIRTCDAFGIHRVDVTTSRNRFKVNRRISQGTHKYIDLRVHADIEQAYAELRGAAYTIAVSDLRAETVIDPDGLRAELAAHAPLAVVFGNEGHGLSEAALAGADCAFRLPMVGFTQSLNLSVTVACTLWHLRSETLIADAPGGMPAPQQQACYEQWLRAHKGDDAVERAIEHDRHGDPLDSYGG